MAHPYSTLHDRAFWSRSVATSEENATLAQSADAGFFIRPSDRLASAGSCFAQHMARLLPPRGFNYWVTESGPSERQFGVYSARYGNVYTVRQLLQLFERAYGLLEPVDVAWQMGECLIDPFRPGVEKSGFADLEALLTDRAVHLAAVRTMFEQCDVFVFTLGQTEAWIAEADGAVFPLAPGVSGSPPPSQAYRHHNFTVQEMLNDMQRFVAHLRSVNPSLKLVLSVSPVPMAATYEDQHVLVANGYTKAALRVVADMVTREDAQAAYFPSFEALAGHQTCGRYYEADKRHITDDGVRMAADMFARLYLSDRHMDDARVLGTAVSKPVQVRPHAWHEEWCDDNLLDTT
jgi:hypothetical protein